MFAVNNPSDRVGRILIVRFSAIGDIILTLPVVDALRERFPEARIDYLTSKEYLELLGKHPGLKRIWSFDRAQGFPELRRLARRLRQERYDLLVDLHYSLRSIYIRLFTGAFMTRSYRKLTFSRLLLRFARVNRLRNAPRVLDRYFTAVADFGLQPQGRRPRLHLSDRALEGAAQALLRAGVGPGRPLLVIAPGASHPTKRWPPPSFAAAAAALAAPGETIALLGGSGDREVAAEVGRGLARAGLTALDLTDRLALAESAAVIGRARLVLTNDSGLMHVADALDRPLVAMFGPTSRELGFYPVGEKARVVELPLPCRPCSLHGSDLCPQNHHRCLRELPVEAVIRAAEEALAAVTPARAASG